VQIGPFAESKGREWRGRDQHAADSAAGTAQIKISLRDVSKPPVWRRVLVPAGIGLDMLSEVIQVAMGWDGGHLHVFSHGREQFGPSGLDLGYTDEASVTLADLLSKPGDKLSYSYDFGDGWEHDLLLEETRHETPGGPPSCVAGKGACPPEDCGGPWGYADLKEVLADPADEEHLERLEWLGLESGDEFDPAEFSVDEVNDRLSRFPVN
jgi:hypothetical protein